jgi:hypothetical protein
VKRLSKIILIALTALIILMGASAVSAFAATKGDVLANIGRGVTINGQHRNIAAKYVRMAQNYLANNDLTPEQLDKIMAAINGARASWEASGTTTYLDMSGSDKKKLTDAATEAAKSADMKIVVDGDQVQTVDPAGRTYTMKLGGDQILKQVGANYTSLTLLCALIILLLAFVIIMARREGLFKHGS